MRKIKILKVNQTTTTPGSIEVAGDLTELFKGRYFRNNAGLTQPGYTNPPASGFLPIVAVTFDVVENRKYAGRYTVFTQTTSADLPSASFNSSTNRTTIRVMEVVPALVSGDIISNSSDGYITNISAYLLETAGQPIILPPGLVFSQFPVELSGRNTSGWGEGHNQNFVNLARNFSGPNPPANPFIGQTYYDTDDEQMRSWNGTAWKLINVSTVGTQFKFTQSTPSNTWTVNHGLNLAAPYIALVQFFVDRGNGPKLIIPADVNFVTANQLTVSFSNPEIGYVIVRS